MFYAKLLYRMYKKGFARGYEAGINSVVRDNNYGLRKDWK
jgi:hypothetical protein